MQQRIQCFLVEPVNHATERRVSDDKPKVSHWIRRDTGEIKDFPHQFGPGAMWFAPWLENIAKMPCTDEHNRPRAHSYHLGPDGRILIVQTPGGSWVVDGRCSNCGKPDDDEHRCWVRHGEAPLITVDKNGLTCAAGAGSIMCGTYHGFLRNGYLEEC